MMRPIYVFGKIHLFLKERGLIPEQQHEQRQPRTNECVVTRTNWYRIVSENTKNLEREDRYTTLGIG